MKSKPKTKEEKTMEVQQTKTIDMKKVMTGLGIDINDIVYVNETYLKCNEKYDLVNLDGRYNSVIPNLILGMISGKYGYKVYSLKHEVGDVKN